MIRLSTILSNLKDFTVNIEIKLQKSITFFIKILIYEQKSEI